MGNSKSTPKPQTSESQPTTTQASNNKKPQVVTKTKETSKTTQQTLITEKQISSIVDNVSKTPETKDTILMQDLLEAYQKHILANPILLQLQEQNRQISQAYWTPLKHNYDQIPRQITQLKFSYLNCYDYKDRLIALGLFSMLVGVMRFRKTMIKQVPLKTLTVIKDSTVAYFIGGLLIAPEIYNPLMDD